ncbi:3D (Asp-Asp-Asp) domain-containing protein [Alkalibacterium subtropicum]|uniref:3D (Asp-Asp-Asp) domain-containing protein n=1 Tax=Alkalibacterium subtropicum TaxID=753702 RepID=A0A1I1K1V0_9LACT|nr:3D domain-containing protein [Alkalibacterium subtropicum]SFC54927.1 3D (Asp-Asp-Asp) domain-containing protein [Alkalibacterium subtropicum]
MTIQKNTWLKAGLTLSAAGLMLLTNDTEASANSNWVPRTVLEIEEDINASKADYGEDETLEYTFQWGDTLWGVSQATDISVDKLATVNDIDNRSLIQVGTTIYLSNDLSIISVENEEEVVSYDVSEDEVKETETPEEVEEVKQEKQEEKGNQAAAEKAAAEKAAAEKAAAEKAAAEKAASTSSNDAAAQEESGRWMSVEATAYSRNQANLSNFTFMGIDLRENSRVIAVDPNVIPLGTKVFVPGYGEYIAGDTGGAIKGNRIDVHMEDLDAAWAFGRRQIDIKILD